MFEFALPWLFLLLPLPWLVYRYLPPVARKVTSALRVPFFNQVRALQSARPMTIKHAWSHWLLPLVIWCCLVSAAAGPQWTGEPYKVAQSGRDIVLALDLSGSMQLEDMQWQGRAVDRLTIVKKTAEEFIRGRGGDRIALVLFGSRAYLQTPLTFDHRTVLHQLNDATIGLAGQRTAIGDAIGLSVKRLQNVADSGRVIVLLTDGANNAGVLDPIQAGKIAADEGIKIYTIGIGANQMVIRSIFGEQVVNPSEDLDEEALREIANLTGGEFFRALDTADLERVYDKIDELEPTENDAQLLRPVTEYYYWPLLLALLLSFYRGVRYA